MPDLGLEFFLGTQTMKLQSNSLPIVDQLIDRWLDQPRFHHFRGLCTLTRRLGSIALTIAFASTIDLSPNSAPPISFIRFRPSMSALGISEPFERESPAAAC